MKLPSGAFFGAEIFPDRLKWCDKLSTIAELLESKRVHVLRLSNQSGASGEADLLLLKKNLVPRPKGAARRILLEALEEIGISIKKTSFDAIITSSPIDFDDAEQVRSNINDMIFVEIKSANQKRVKTDFSGFFFAITEGEIEASEKLGGRHKVFLYNKKNKHILVTSIPEILSRSKSMNWQVSVQL